MKDYQKLFHIPEGQHYFLSHAIGLMPTSTKQAIEEGYLQAWKSGAEDIWDYWLQQVQGFNQALATLLNARANQICPQVNLSSALSKVLLALPRKNNQNVIVVTESDFPSVGFVLQQASKLGFELRWIPKEQDLQSLDTWEQVLDDKVHTAFITQVHYNTNLLTPVESIAQICRQKGIYSIVDAAQAVGIVPINLSSSYCDVVLGSCIKWLCGGSGAGFMWLNDLITDQLQPYDVGWFSHQNPFEFDIHHFKYADDASRFWGGTPSVAPFVIARNSIELISQIGIDKIQAHNNNLSLKLMRAVPDNCIVSPREVKHKGGTVILRFDNQEKAIYALQDAGVLHDARQYGIRLSPHIYTKESDIDVAIDVFCLVT